MKLKNIYIFQNVTPIVNNELLKGQCMDWFPNYNGKHQCIHNKFQFN
jgi:hypothetical protein